MPFNEELQQEIHQLLAEDQRYLKDLESEEDDSAFLNTLFQYKEQLHGDAPVVFWKAAAYQRWANSKHAPILVQQYAAWSGRTTKRIKAIIANTGWMLQEQIGVDATAFLYVLFAHTDTENAWRRAQVPAITAALHAGEIKPRWYAHLCDRIEACDGKHQLYGTIMGPSHNDDGAQIYWPLANSIKTTDTRRHTLGLPPIEEDLRAYRAGATIGSFMTPTLEKDPQL